MGEIISRTQSVCPVCLRVLDGERTVGDDGCVYLEKTCPEHGFFSTLIWEGSREEYEKWGDNSPGNGDIAAPIPAEKGCPYDCGLCSDHRSKGCCVLLEVTNRCNLRCPVCFAAAGEAAPRDLPMDEISAQYDMLMQRGGPFNIQLSGGEPTMRDDLPEIIALGREKGFTFFQLNTNGIRLAEEKDYAQRLKSAGLDCVFLQFDGFAENVYTALRGKMLLDKKLHAIDNCADAGLGVVLVPVIAPGINDGALGDILLFAMSRMPAVRGVHFQPVSHFGRYGLENSGYRLTIPRMLRELERQTGGIISAGDFGGGGAESPYCSFHASYMRTPDGGLRALSRNGSCSCQPDTAREFVMRQWSGNLPESSSTDSPMEETSSLDEFLRRARDNTFTVSGMLFQDAWNLDLDRLRRCYICEADSSRGMVPFCAYNLTDINGRSIYRT